jgi:hypothetical protein
MGSVLKPFRWLATAVALATLLASAAPARAADPEVRVSIVVIDAERAKGTIDKRLKALKLDTKLTQLGFTSAKVTDELNTTVSKGAGVSLEILRKSGKPRMLRVQVLEADPKTGEVRLNVAVPELEFKADTKHKKGGTFMLTIPRGESKRLFMAVTPKIQP